MIVQTAPEGEPHFIITQVDHARMSGQFAAAWGNDTFAALIPREPMEFMVAHHDEGWLKVDDAWLFNESTRLPYHLTETPLPEYIKTGAGSPEFNQAHHSYSGILSSMHTWGLYRGSYGLSDTLFINSIPAEHRPQVDALLEGEIARQDNLKRQIDITNLELMNWIKPTQLFHNYKLLQFFDALALYFHTTHEAARKEVTFPNVPMSVGKDETLTVRRQSAGVYSVTPYPFAKEKLEVSVEGRYLYPLEKGMKLSEVIWATPKTLQSYTLIAG
jgi:hypothetical protein